jgi:hypothetical protein
MYSFYKCYNYVNSMYMHAQDLRCWSLGLALICQLLYSGLCSTGETVKYIPRCSWSLTRSRYTLKNLVLKVLFILSKYLMHACARHRAPLFSPFKLILHSGHGNILTRKRIHLIMYLAAHTTEKPQDLHTSSTIRIIRNTTSRNSTTKAMQDDANQVIVLLFTQHNLGVNICRVSNRRHMPNYRLSHIN